MARNREPLLEPAPTFDLGAGLELRRVRAEQLQEQDINAQVMEPAQFDRLTDNIRRRGALESLPYCAQPDSKGPVEIVSGHHRVRAAVAAGVRDFWVLVDTSPMTRSQLTAKQIAHNQLVGHPDEAILRQLLARVDGVDDLLETGLGADFLPTPQDDSATIATPHADFDWRTVTFTFLPHQLDDFRALVEEVEGRQDLVGIAPLETFEPFAKALAAYQRVKNVLAIGTTIALLTAAARAEVERLSAEETP